MTPREEATSRRVVGSDRERLERCTNGSYLFSTFWNHPHSPMYVRTGNPEREVFLAICVPTASDYQYARCKGVWEREGETEAESRVDGTLEESVACD